MKKVFGIVIDGIVACVVFVLFGLCLIFLLPFDYIKYKRSLYYESERKRYSLFAAGGRMFEIYNLILKNYLPINYIANSNELSLEYGWFIFNDTLIITNVFSFEYDDVAGSWNYCCFFEDDEQNETRCLISLDEYIESEIREANELEGDIICNKAIVLIDASYIENADIAIKEKRFIVYNNGLEEALVQLCNK